LEKLSGLTGWEEKGGGTGDGDSGGSIGGGGRGRREIRLGDLVRVLGWMKCVAILGGGTSPRPSPTVRVIRTRKTGEEGRESEMVWETARCVREVHVHGIRREEDEPVFDRETVHWLRCLQFVRRVGNGVRGDRGWL